NTLFTTFFFQAEDGIRVFHVTGVQTCALPICAGRGGRGGSALARHVVLAAPATGKNYVPREGTTTTTTTSGTADEREFVRELFEIGRASCRATRGRPPGSRPWRGRSFVT